MYYFALNPGDSKDEIKLYPSGHFEILKLVIKEQLKKGHHPFKAIKDAFEVADEVETRYDIRCNSGQN